MIKTVTATRYVTPLREGGSLPAVIEADDGQMYVMKFVGAGQGRKALIAELVAGEIGRALGLRVPEIVFAELDPALGPSEPDPEIFDLLKASVGLNLGFRYLPSAFTFSPLISPPSADLASSIVWFDAFVTNVDRTPRNVNILIWQKELWLIDHGACLYFHHDWKDYLERSRSPFTHIKDHTLLPYASALAEAGVSAHRRLNPERLELIVEMIPDAWLNGNSPFDNHSAHRRAYADFLLNRLDASHIFVEEANRARTLPV